MERVINNNYVTYIKNQINNISILEDKQYQYFGLLVVEVTFKNQEEKNQEEEWDQKEETEL